MYFLGNSNKINSFMGNTRKGKKERLKKLEIRGKYSGHEYREFF